MINKFMKLALDEAKKVEIDVPVVAIIVKDNEIISIAANKKEKNNLTTSHAEILAIQEANKKLNNWRLDGCDMYVNLEPCPMCGWAIKMARINHLYFGSYDFNYGAISKFKMLDNYKGGILEKDCDKLLDDYFKKLRK